MYLHAPTLLVVTAIFAAMSVGFYHLLSKAYPKTPGPKSWLTGSALLTTAFVVLFIVASWPTLWLTFAGGMILILGWFLIIHGTDLFFGRTRLIEACAAIVSIAALAFFWVSYSNGERFYYQVATLSALSLLSILATLRVTKAAIERKSFYNWALAVSFGLQGLFFPIFAVQALAARQDVVFLASPIAGSAILVVLVTLIGVGVALTGMTFQDVTLRLARNAADMRALLDTSPAVVTLTGRDGRIRWTNARVTENTALPRDVLVGALAADSVVNLADRAEITDALRKHGGIREKETVLFRPDGTAYPALITARQVDFAGERMTIVWIADITAQKAIQERLARDERKFRSIIQNASEGFILRDNDSVILDANDAMLRIIGRKAEEFIGTTGDFLLDDRNREVLDRHRSRRKDGESTSYELAFRRPDGSEVPCLVQGVPLRDSKGKVTGAFAFVTDLTEIRRAQAEIAESERRVRRILGTMSEGFSVIDAEGRIVEANAALSAMLGFERNEILGHDFREFVHREDIARMNAQVRDRVSGRSGRYETRYLAKDGMVIPASVQASPLTDDFGKVIGSFAFISDLTAIKKAEAEAAVNERRLRRILGVTSAGFFTASPRGELSEVNDSLCAMLGREREELIGRPLADFVTSEDRGELRQALRTAAAGLSGVVELRLVRPSGEAIVGLVKGGSVFDDRGDYSGLFGLVDDITAIRRAQVELEKAKEEAETANKAKSEFLSRMSHELRTPLNAIIGFAQILETDTAEPLSAYQQSAIGHVREAGSYLLELVDEVLDLARIEAGRMAMNFEILDLDELIASCLDLSRATAEGAGVVVDPVAPPIAPRSIRADLLRAKEVLLNLVSNAIKYNREGGHVTVTVTPGANNSWRVAVADQGAGIPEERQAEAFRPFNRLGQEFSAIKGTGMGLALSKQFVELMAGRIGFTSRQDVGTVFWVELPIATESTAAATAQEPTQRAAEAPEISGTVLCVEDNPVNVELIRSMLRRETGVRVLVSPDAEGGIEMARRDRPDLILLDVNLPGMSGLEAIKTLRAMPETAAIPVFALTAAATQDDVAAGAKAGFNRYVTKPIDMKPFLAMVGEALAKARQ
ncbi:MAG: PAS domain S-box protein [Alphaproteobacteria bacterium]|nr:PAS domain S-box protein [Alphaproteobacteria bacterium]